MLRWIRSIDWTAIGASAFILIALVLVLPGQKQTVSATYQPASKLVIPSSPEERLADYTLGLEIFTAVLAMFGGLEIWLLFRTDETARRQIAIQGAQTDILVKQKEIARQQFLAAYRSKLRIRLVKIRPLLVGGEVHIEFQLVNIGTFAAVVTATQVTIIFDDVSENGAFTRGCPSWTGSVSLPQQIIKAGETVLVSQPTGIIFRDWRCAHATARWDANGNIRITGAITYMDDAEIIRRTGFYRVSTGDTNRFVRLDNPDINADYEYED